MPFDQICVVLKILITGQCHERACTSFHMYDFTSRLAWPIALRRLYKFLIAVNQARKFGEVNGLKLTVRSRSHATSTIYFLTSWILIPNFYNNQVLDFLRTLLGVWIPAPKINLIHGGIRFLWPYFHPTSVVPLHRRQLRTFECISRLIYSASFQFRTLKHNAGKLSLRVLKSSLCLLESFFLN